MGGPLVERCACHRVAVTRPRGQPAGVVLGIPDDRPAGVVPGVGATALALVQDGPSRPSRRSSARCSTSSGSVPDGIVLVLDDYHVVDGPAIQAGMTYLLEHLPRSIASGDRHPRRPCTAAGPTACAGRARRDSRGGPAVHARRGDRVPQRGDGPAPGRPEIAALEGRTEGWIAALQLAALSMQGRDDIAGFIAGFAGDDRYIVDYLVEEVLQRQPDHIRSFLLETLDPRTVDWLTVRRRHRPGGRQGDAGVPRSRESLPRPPRRPQAVVSVPPPVR